uniref:Uncharacterized protein n=1 Tax=Anguilla anguilla TaxID=7936 RepID=A0A0E9WUG9_ANGAN
MIKIKCYRGATLLKKDVAFLPSIGKNGTSDSIHQRTIHSYNSINPCTH